VSPTSHMRRRARRSTPPAAPTQHALTQFVRSP
jgi:hypothetical protein